MEIESRAAMLLALEVSRLHGRIENGIGTDHEKGLMRILTPLAKLVTGKQTVAVCSEGLECFGGQVFGFKIFRFLIIFLRFLSIKTLTDINILDL